MYVSSEGPWVSKEKVRCSTEGIYEHYCITANNGLIEELTLGDIIFIKNALDKLVKEKQVSKKKGKQ